MIGSNAFGGSYSLQKIELPNSVKTIGSYAFAGCTALKEITVPPSVTSIGKDAFESCGYNQSTKQYEGLIVKGKKGSDVENYVKNVAKERDLLIFEETNTFIEKPANWNSKVEPSSPVVQPTQSTQPSATPLDATPTDPPKPLTRLAGFDRYDTAAAIVKDGWTQSDYVVIAYGENYPDALAASPLAYKYEAPILLTRSNDLPEITKQTLTDLQVKNVIIVGGSGVISATVETELKNMGLNVTRVFGNDKYDTAVEVAKRVSDPAKPTEIFVVTGDDFSDALSVGSIAANKQMPIILVPKNSVPDSVNNYLAATNISKSYIIGNTDLISENVCSQFPKSERILGSNKYERNIAVLQKFADNINSERLFLATGELFADALAGSVYCARLSEAIVLINNEPPANTKNYYLQRIPGCSKVFVFGGTGIIPDSVISELK